MHDTIENTAAAAHRRSRLSANTLVFACLAIVILTVSPFFLVQIPPLIDAPGHLAQLAVQAAGSESPLRQYFQFHWALRLNLGTDLLVEALRGPLGLMRAFWLITALIPALTAVAILAVALVANRRGAAGLGWALMFSYAWPFSYGFLNFSLSMALSILGFAVWVALAGRPRLREWLFWPLIPILMIGHAVGGGLLVIFIFVWTCAERAEARNLAHAGQFKVRDLVRIAVDARPIFAVLPIILLWKLSDHSANLPTYFRFKSKLQALVMALRDQNRWLDIFCVVAIVAVLIAGHRLGARYSRPARWLVAAVALLFLAIPSHLNGASFVDMRLVPAAAILALVLQDWSGVKRHYAMIVTAAGLALFLVRMILTITSYSAYQQSYDAEARALPHIASGSRVLTLLTRQCNNWQFWRMSRLDHISSLATVDRDAWTNSLWDLGSIHLIQVRYRPSPIFYNDPSHYVWPASCIRANRKPPTNYEGWRNRRITIDEALPTLPLDKADYLWLIATKLPATPLRSRLRPVWSNGGSTLYRIVPAATARGLT